MNYDDTKDEVFRMMRAIERRELIKTLGLVAVGLMVVFTLLALTFCSIARDNAAADERLEVYRQQMQESFATIARAQAATNEHLKEMLLREQLMRTITAIHDLK